MAFDIVRELKGAEVAAYREAQLREIALIYQAAERDIKAEILSVSVSDFSRARGNQLLRQVDGIWGALTEQSNEWAEDVLPMSYDRGVQVAEKQLKRLDIAGEVDTGSLIHTQAVNVLGDQMAADFAVANGYIKRDVGRYIRRAQVLRNQDRALSRSIGKGIVRGQALRDVSDAVLNDLRGSIESGKFIRVGKARMQASKYAELVARTRTREAVTEGTLNSAAQFGMDLVMIDVHDDPCPFCQQFSGRVYSVSGTHPDFPALERRPPFHPNCECTLHPTTEGHLKSSGKYDELVVLSNDPKIPILGDDDYQAILGRSATQEAKAEKVIRKKAKKVTKTNSLRGVQGEVIPHDIREYKEEFGPRLATSLFRGGEGTNIARLAGPDRITAKNGRKYITGRPNMYLHEFVSSGKEQPRVAAAARKISEKTGLDEEFTRGLLNKWAGSSNDHEITSLRLQKAASRVFGAPFSVWQRARLDQLLENRKSQIRTNGYVHQRELMSRFETEGSKPRGLAMRLDPDIAKSMGVETIEQAEDKFLRAIYENTQEELKREGIDEMVLYRGVRNAGPSDGAGTLAVKEMERAAEAGHDTIRLSPNALESWSLDAEVANGFSYISKKRQQDSAMLAATVPRERILSTGLTGYGTTYEFEAVVIGGDKDDVSVYNLLREVPR